jgi:hypothetical protein
VLERGRVVAVADRQGAAFGVDRRSCLLDAAVGIEEERKCRSDGVIPLEDLE